ncbi:uncharacterized protein Dwil_GK18965 [Drosophila willistoni]|uniref:BPTI/Kunitz inhibitor domain-containing protein n=2 Tax=Drosophila willistoni TaxID=7260 RepID=B4NKE3_DROWI|nr:uncharacterized protein Dwil_GK18965 [Drosophila willistoni]
MLAACLAAVKHPSCAESTGERGDCRAMHKKWTYHPNSNQCIRFFYSGCHGNSNNFDTQEECEQRCRF